MSIDQMASRKFLDFSRRPLTPATTSSLCQSLPESIRAISLTPGGTIVDSSRVSAPSRRGGSSPFDRERRRGRHARAERPTIERLPQACGSARGTVESLGGKSDGFKRPTQRRAHRTPETGIAPRSQRTGEDTGHAAPPKGRYIDPVPRPTERDDGYAVRFEPTCPSGHARAQAANADAVAHARLVDGERAASSW